MIVTVTPNPSLDLTYQLDSGGCLSDAGVEVHRARSVSLEASGKGVNVSRALTLAGRPSPAVLFAGGATGRQLVDLLTAEGVPHLAVPQAGATRVNTTVLSPSGTTAKLNAPGVEPSQTERDNLVIAVNNEVITLSSDFSRVGGPVPREDPPNWLLICGSMPPGDGAEALVGQLVERAHAHGWRVAVDSSGPGLSAGLDAGADLLAPNAAELAGLLGPDVNPDADLFVAAAALAAERGCELLVSLGADGAMWTDGVRALHARGPAIVPVNSAGAGDALLAGWFAGSPVASSPVASSPGASSPGASSPGASSPGASSPGASSPGASSPGASSPGASSPVADRRRRLATAVAWGTAGCLASTTVATGGIPPAIDVVMVSDLLAAP